MKKLLSIFMVRSWWMLSVETPPSAPNTTTNTTKPKVVQDRKQGSYQGGKRVQEEMEKENKAADRRAVAFGSARLAFVVLGLRQHLTHCARSVRLRVGRQLDGLRRGGQRPLRRVGGALGR